MRATTESAAARDTSTTSAPVPLTVPANTSAPGVLVTGSGSPVIEAWSTSLAPSTTYPSAPIRSPGRTRTRSPGVTAAVSRTSSVPSSRRRVARSGARVSSERTESWVRLVATASNAPDVEKMTISRAPSSGCPIAAAASAATIISRSTSRLFSRSVCSPASVGSQPPVR